MTIQEFIQTKIDEGYSLNRLSNILNVNTSSLSRQLNGKSKNVRLSLVISIYQNFNIKLEGFHESELSKDL